MVDDPVLSAVMADAKAAIQTGHPKRAHKLLGEYRTEGWESPEFLALLGAACCFAGHPEEAVPVLERALEVKPCAAAHFNLGQALQAQGRIQEAVECYNHALALDPTYGKALQAIELTLPPEQRHHGIDDSIGGRHVEYAEEPHPDEHAQLLTDFTGDLPDLPDGWEPPPPEWEQGQEDREEGGGLEFPSMPPGPPK